MKEVSKLCLGILCKSLLEPKSNNGLKIPWSYTRPLPQLGQIWLESLRQGSVNRNEDMSIWTYADPIGNLGEKDARYLNPFTMIQNSFLGSNLFRPHF